MRRDICNRFCSLQANAAWQMFDWRIKSSVMNLRLKVLLLATMPLLLAIAVISAIVSHQASELSEQEIRVFEETMLKAKKAELRHYVSLAMTSIEHLYQPTLQSSRDEIQKAQAIAKRILNQLNFGPDGYFYVYDYDGKNLVHPKQTWRVGNSYWELEDKEGRKVIQNLIAQAKNGGGYYRYSWEKPSLKQVADKIGYAVGLPRWNWMIGTGIYIDDVTTQVAQAKAETQNRIRETFLIIAIITLGAVLAVFATGIAINMHETKLANSKLQHLTQKIVSTQEEERGRVARELHDGISQLLVSVKFTLDRAQRVLGGSKTETAEAIDKAADTLNVAIREVRQISRGLRPGILDDLGLAKALQSLAEDFSQRTGIEVDLRTTPVGEQVSSEAKTTLFRIAQEAFTNIERHAQATQAKLQLATTDRRVRLMVSDNGKGFDMAALKNGNTSVTGLGMKNIQERIEHFQGHLSVHSTRGGTRIEVNLPLH
ncbi:MAG: cache domain-containing protein [Pseudomonadota bacterium]